MTVDENLEFVVSGRLKSDFDNGKHYYDLQGTVVRSPLLPSAAPSNKALQWHRENRFLLSAEDPYPRRDAPEVGYCWNRAYADGGAHEGSNGLLLRTDIHKLFDLGYVTVDENLEFVVSGRLKSDFDNGKHYYDLQGTVVRSPLLPSAAPSNKALQWHRENRFLG